MPLEYVCVTPDHVLLLLDALPFVCYMTFMFDMVILALLAKEVFQDAWGSTVVFQKGPYLFNCQARRQKVFLQAHLIMQHPKLSLLTNGVMPCMRRGGWMQYCSRAGASVQQAPAPPGGGQQEVSTSPFFHIAYLF